MSNYWPTVLDGALVTLGLSIIVLLLATVWGFIIGLICSIPVKPIAVSFNFINNLIKTPPPILVLPSCYYLPPFFANINISIFSASVLGLTICMAPYLTESFTILFKQSPQNDYPNKIVTFIPSYFTNFAMIIRDSSLASLIALSELTYVSRHISMATLDYSIYLKVAAIYMIIGILLIYVGKLLAFILATKLMTKKTTR